MLANTPSILSVKDLKISFLQRGSSTTAVDGISFDLKKGETLAIVGESGSGKSVSSLAIMQLIPSPPATIETGSISYQEDESIDLLKLSEKGIIKYRGAKIAMIFQEPMSALNPSQRCGRQVMEMLELHKDIPKADMKAKVLSAFADVDLPDPNRIFKSYPHELSGGQLQRVMIAMALICEPDILIADEPTTALDVTIQQKIVELLANIKTQLGISTIFITHDLGLVRQIADRVIVMYKGKIVEQGDVETIFNNPSEAYTKGLIACRPPLDVRYDRLPTIDKFLGSDKSVAEIVKPLIEPVSVFAGRLKEIAVQPVILEAKNLKKYYPSEKNFWGRPTSFVKAVDDVSFQLRKGETLGLVGESGCGKSTLSKVIMRLSILV